MSSDIAPTAEQLFHKYGGSNRTPHVGQRVLIERGGKSDEAAFSLGEVISADMGGPGQEGRLVVKEKSVFFADGRVTTPHRSPLIFPGDHFAKPIQERMRERAERLATAARNYQQWAETPPSQKPG